MAKDDPDDEFTQEDEETLVMFASQAALVIANASQHRSEQQARENFETLIETSPVGVAVFDARTGAPISFNREAARIVGALQTPGRPLEQLLEVLTIRRADGREISLDEFPMAQADLHNESLSIPIHCADCVLIQGVRCMFVRE